MDAAVMSGLLGKVCDVARQAGRAILEEAGKTRDVQTKADGTPLTRADLASHRVIQTGLDSLDPRLPTLSEEGDLDQGRADWGAFWCVDPLDGTKEFIKGLDEYTVNIALIERGEPVLGAVYVPVQDVLYWGALGLGAWRSSGAGRGERISPRKSDRPVTAVVSRSHLSDKTLEFLQRIGVKETVGRGSSIKICAVAEGSADVYPRYGPTCLWDTAAAAAIARQAGCAVVDLQGAALSYDPSAGLKRSGFIVYPLHLDELIRRALG